MTATRYSTIVAIGVVVVMCGIGLWLNTPTILAEDDAILLSGRVTSDVDASPIADVNIILYEEWTTNHHTVAHTDASGYYTLTASIAEQIPITMPANYLVRFESQDAHIAEYFGDTPFIFDAEPITLTSGTHVSGINASLALGGLIRGTVTRADDGQPLAQARLSIRPTDSFDLREGILSDNSGAYTITGIVSGTYYLRVQPPVADPLYVSLYYPNKVSVDGAEMIEISPGTNITDANFSMPLGGHIQGVISSDRGSAWFLHAKVAVYDEDGDLLLDRLTRTDEHGGYLLTDLLPGNYRLLMNEALHAHKPEFYDNQPSLALATPVQVSAGQVTTNIDAVLSLTRTVVSIATSTALPNRLLLSLAFDAAPLFSHDGGETWRALPSTPWVNLMGGSPLVGLTRQNGSQSSVRMLVAASSKYLGFENGLYRSGDYGENWTRQKFPYGSCTVYEQTFMGLIVSPVDPTRIFLLNNCYDSMPEYRGIYSRLFISLDAGSTWQEKPEQQDGNPAGTRAVFPSPVLADHVYVNGSYPYWQAMWAFSNDGGQIWTAKEFDLETLALDADDATVLYGITTHDPILPASRFGVRSVAGGDNWTNWAEQPCQLGSDLHSLTNPVQLMAHPTLGQTLFIRCAAGLYRSNNGGDSWTQLDSVQGQLLAPDYGNSGRILWARDDGLWATTDSGDTWTAIMPNYQIVAPTYEIPIFLPNVSAHAEDE